jgi:hypothetical protein
MDPFDDQPRDAALLPQTAAIQKCLKRGAVRTSLLASSRPLHEAPEDFWWVCARGTAHLPRESRLTPTTFVMRL